MHFLVSVINGPLREDANGPRQYSPNERPCPTCRGPICKEKLFNRSAFEPDDSELDGKSDDDDVEMIDTEAVDVKGKGKGKEVLAPRRTLRKRKLIRQIVDSDEDSMDDFIVEDDAYEEPKTKNTVGKGKQRAIVLSDDEDDDIIFGAKPAVPVPIGNGEIKTLPKFLPSTKMKVRYLNFLSIWLFTSHCHSI